MSESIIVAVLKNEEDALSAEHQLHRMNENGDITLGKDVVIRKKPDETFEHLKAGRSGVGKDAFIGLALGGLATLLAGPLLFFVGLLTGTAVGAAVGYKQTDIDKDMVEKIKSELHEGDIALIANCEEHSSTALDEVMTNYKGAKLYRTTVA